MIAAKPYKCKRALSLVLSPRGSSKSPEKSSIPCHCWILSWRSRQHTDWTGTQLARRGCAPPPLWLWPTELGHHHRCRELHPPPPHNESIDDDGRRHLGHGNSPKHAQGICSCSGSVVPRTARTRTTRWMGCRQSALRSLVAADETVVAHYEAASVIEEQPGGWRMRTEREANHACE